MKHARGQGRMRCGAFWWPGGWDHDDYKGYTAGAIDFDPQHSVFSGTVADLKDVIHFEERTAKELEKSCRYSIGDYLALCAERNEAPDRSFNGKILVRTAPELHR